jgi:hypothetical protein
LFSSNAVAKYVTYLNRDIKTASFVVCKYVMIPTFSWGKVFKYDNSAKDKYT